MRARAGPDRELRRAETVLSLDSGAGASCPKWTLRAAVRRGCSLLARAATPTGSTASPHDRDDCCKGDRQRVQPSKRGSHRCLLRQSVVHEGEHHERSETHDDGHRERPDTSRAYRGEAVVTNLPFVLNLKVGLHGHRLPDPGRSERQIGARTSCGAVKT
jgi:hypothetical protein